MFRSIHVRTMKLVGLTVLSGGLFIAVSSVTPDGRMTGGGSAFVSGGNAVNPDGTRVTHGFQLQCNVNEVPNNLQVNWGPGNRFHLESVTMALCTSQTPPENCLSAPPDSPFFNHSGVGTGRYNGIPGATVSWKLSDCGEPGTQDLAEIYVRNREGDLVLELRTTLLESGNHQAHRLKKPKQDKSQ